jgi:hypothetical protein
MRHPYKPVAKFLEDLHSKNWRTLSQQGQAVVFSIVGSTRKSVDLLLSCPDNRVGSVFLQGHKRGMR